MGMIRFLGIGVQKGITDVSFVPLAEGGSIDLDDRALDEGVCTNQLVVRSVVDLTTVT